MARYIMINTLYIYTHIHIFHMDNNSSKHLSKIPTPLEGGDEGGGWTNLSSYIFSLNIYIWKKSTIR